MASWKEVALVEDLAGFAQTNATDNAIPYGTATGGFDYTSAGTAGQILTVTGVHPEFVTMGGDASIIADGTLTIGALAIETGMIENDAVTLDKMAGLDKGHIIYGNASNNPASLSEGTDGYVLTQASGMPSWAPAGSVTSITITENDAAGPNYLAFTADNSGAGCTLLRDDDLSYNAQDNILTCVTFEGALSGNATSASTISTTLAGNNDTLYVPLVDAATATSGETLETCAAIVVTTDSDFTSSAANSTVTIAGNLVVSGETTTLNTATLSVEDKTIVCGSGATTMSTNNLSGLVINGGSATDEHNPRIMWKNDGGDPDAETATTLGWAIADHGTLSSSATSADSTLYNIAPTLINQTGVPGVASVGRGSMYLTHDGNSGEDSKLYIQVD